jgi:Uma2 family endonuclease
MATLPNPTVATEEGLHEPCGSSSLVRRFTLEEFEKMVDLFPDDQLELINGEIIMSPPPDDVHIEQTMNVEYLLAKQLNESRNWAAE